jgi:hypothetical protein
MNGRRRDEVRRVIPLATHVRPYVVRQEPRRWGWEWWVPAWILSVALAFVLGQIVGTP